MEISTCMYNVAGKGNVKFALTYSYFRVKVPYSMFASLMKLAMM